MKKLVAFLGMGGVNEPAPHYRATRYLDGAFRSGETPLVQAALIERAQVAGQPFDEVVILGTESVEKRWIHTGELGRRLGYPAFQFKRVPEGKTVEEFWTLFKMVGEELELPGIAGSASPDEIVLDITHGFRTQGMVAISALEYIISEWGRKRLDVVPIVSVSYGAFEAKELRDGIEVSPLWDLTGLVLAGRWNSAIDAVVRYGRGDDFNTLGNALGAGLVRQAMAQGGAGAALRPARFPAELSGAVGSFCDDLATGRIENLFLRSAPYLARMLGSPAAEDLSKALPAVREALKWLKKEVDLLCADDVVGESGIRATANYAVLCGKLQRFAEQAAAVREGSIALYGLRAKLEQHGLTRSSKKSDREAFVAGREAVNTAWNESGRKAMVKHARDALRRELGDAFGAADLGQRVFKPRNDLLHLGLNLEPSSATKLMDQLNELSNHFAELTGALSSLKTDETGEPQPDRFFNLSNHSISSWSETQLRAAVSLELGEVCDLPGGFPLVDPDANEAHIAEIAQLLAISVAAAGARGAYVSGEYCLAFALVAELQRRGVRCFAATTQRIVEEHPVEEGDRGSTHHFVFGRWREYSRLA